MNLMPLRLSEMNFMESGITSLNHEPRIIQLPKLFLRASSMGIFSFGLVSMGLLSSGLVTMGLAAFGQHSMGLVQPAQNQQDTHHHHSP
ncbi:MAG: hypothetical protein HC769_28110 [Cyanobacteria bacterium CRU_2_1]|nr:hypothetical protein [Cyanobacteria bacterium CRU_2_1]